MVSASEIASLAAAGEASVVAWRRRLHEWPELSFEEFETADFLAARLEELGYRVSRGIGGTGVVGLLDTGRPGPVLAFRADMDALPLLEATDLGFASRRAGIMHGCGHDAHMAVVLGTAAVLAGLRGRLRGAVKILFQPGEEANGGARCMIEGGALREPAVDAIVAIHVMPELPTGSIGLKAGFLSATDDEVTIRIAGRGGHSSAPHECVDALFVAAQAAVALQGVRAAAVSPHQVATFSLCTFRAGEAVNVIAERAEMRGMIRCVERADKLAFRERIERVAKGIAEGAGAKAEVEFLEGFPAVNNDPELARLAGEVAAEALPPGGEAVWLRRPHLGSEDFSYYQEAVPGLIFLLGVGGESCARGSLHSTDLDLDEAALPVGVRMLAGIGARICGRDEEATGPS